MDPTLNTHPSNATQAKAFTAATSFSFPSNGAGDITPPSSDKDVRSQQSNGYVNSSQTNGANPAQNAGNGVTPATPAATPGAAGQVQGVSGIVPTLQ